MVSAIFHWCSVILFFNYFFDKIFKCDHLVSIIKHTTFMDWSIFFDYFFLNKEIIKTVRQVYFLSRLLATQPSILNGPFTKYRHSFRWRKSLHELKLVTWPSLHFVFFSKLTFFKYCRYIYVVIHINNLLI